MAHLELRHSFRSRYEYNNLAYLTLGLALTNASGMPWHQFIRQRLCEPAGMKGVVCTRSEALAAPDHATPHRIGSGGKPVPISWYDDDRQIRGSVSLKTSARARVLLLPRRRLGLVVLVNLSTQGAAQEAFTLLDYLLRLPARDWHAHFQAANERSRAQQRQERERLLAKRLPNTHTSLPLPSYTGTFHEPAYGNVQITLEKKQLLLHWSSYALPLEHFHLDTFTIQTNKEEPQGPFVDGLPTLDSAAKERWRRFSFWGERSRGRRDTRRLMIPARRRPRASTPAPAFPGWLRIGRWPG
jgi:hypothetical protein